jgi:hypothetical protein
MRERAARLFLRFVRWAAFDMILQEDVAAEALGLKLEDLKLDQQVLSSDRKVSKLVAPNCFVLACSRRQVRRLLHSRRRSNGLTPLSSPRSRLRQLLLLYRRLRQLHHLPQRQQTRSSASRRVGTGRLTLSLAPRQAGCLTSWSESMPQPQHPKTINRQRLSRQRPRPRPQFR